MLTLGSLFDGIGTWQLSARHNGIKPLWSCEIDPYPSAVSHYHFPETKQYGDIKEIHGSSIEPVDILCAGSPCFLAGTLVTTSSGQIPIEDIVVGDMVITHNNTFKKVTKVGHKTASAIYKLKCQGSPITYVTGNHPYYVRHMTRKWDNAKREYVRTFSSPTWKPVSELEKDDYIGFPVNQESYNKYNLTMEESWLIGRYVADGCIRDGRRKGRVNQYNHQVIFCIGKNKKDSFLNNVHEYHVGCKEGRTAYKMVIINERLKDLCHKCGRGAANKDVPSFIVNLPNELLASFLDGYISGDGCLIDGKYQATTISRKLALSLQLVVHKLYHTPCKVYFASRPKTTIIEGREVNQSDSWMVVFKKEKQKQNHAIYIDGIVWQPYKQKERINGNFIVYNLEVEDDHSYTANGVIVHNCQNLSQAGNHKGLNGEKSSLFYEAIRILHEMRRATNGKYPRFFVWENVVGSFTSTHGNDFRAVLEEVGQTQIPMPKSGRWATCGVARLPLCDIAWRTLDAQYWGVPQRRRRIFLVADFTATGKRAAEILLVEKRLPGHSQESSGEKQNPSYGTETGTPGTGNVKTYSAQSYTEIKESNSAATLKAQGGALGGGTENYVAIKR